VKGIKAVRVKFNIGNLWESAALHILFTKEDDFVVARCLDFMISSHGKDEEEALRALADSLKVIPSKGSLEINTGASRSNQSANPAR